MRARFLANTSMSTAPILIGAGAASSFMVTPPPPNPQGRGRLTRRRPDRFGPCFGHISGLPEFQINILNLREFHACGRIFAEGFWGPRSGDSERWDGWNGAGSHGGMGPPGA